MSNKKLIRSNLSPYHVYNRCQDKNFYEVPLNTIWPLTCDLLRTLTWSFGFRIHAFVLMSNHYHLLTSTPDENLDKGMAYFQSQFSKWMFSVTQKQRFRFSGRYKASLILDESHFLKVYQYVYQNPVRAGLANQAEDYLYSTLAGRMGIQQNFPPIFLNLHYAKTIHLEISKELRFINENLNLDEVKEIKLGTRHSEFQWPERPRFLKTKKTNDYVENLT